jgi:hypothetical protein
MTDFTDSDRELQDYWLQKIPPGSAADAILHALELILKHELGDIRTVIKGYQDMGRADDALILRVSDSMAVIVAQNDTAIPKLNALLAKVQLLETGAQVVIVDQAQNQRRLDSLEGRHDANADPRAAFIEQAADMMKKLTTLITQVALLKTGEQYATISRAKVNRRLDALEGGDAEREVSQ